MQRRIFKIALGDNTQVTHATAALIQRCVESIGKADVYLLPSLDLVVVPAGCVPPPQGGLRSVLLGTFATIPEIDVDELREEITYAIDVECPMPKAQIEDIETVDNVCVSQ